MRLHDQRLRQNIATPPTKPRMLNEAIATDLTRQCSNQSTGSSVEPYARLNSASAWADCMSAESPRIPTNTKYAAPSIITVPVTRSCISQRLTNQANQPADGASGLSERL